jgi:protein phosphatase
MSSAFPFHVAARTDVGRQRRQNEDAMLVAPDLGVCVVCDGMGGHASGALASYLGVTTIRTALASGEPLVLSSDEPLVVAIEEANRLVRERAAADEACHGMGTTVVGFRHAGAGIALCHVGDSRAYRLRGHVLEQLTRDHSLRNLYADHPELVGKFGPARANVIVRAIGLHETIDVELREVEVAPGDVLLLCSDGLHEMVDERLIAEILGQSATVDSRADELIRAALDAGGLDNVTAVVAERT